MKAFDENQTQNRRAVIDVGSNSVKLLVAEVAAGDVTPLVHEGEQTRLGRGVFDSGKLDPEAIAQTAFVAGRFAEKARRMGAVEVKAVATSAAREARNGMDLIEAFREVNVPLTIIEGDREAELVLRGVRSHPIFLMGRWRLSTWAGAVRNCWWRMKPACACSIVSPWERCGCWNSID